MENRGFESLSHEELRDVNGGIAWIYLPWIVGGAVVTVANATNRGEHSELTYYNPSGRSSSRRVSTSS